MATRPRTITLSLDQRLRDSQRQATSMSLPLAVLHRLDLLAGAAADANATRAEIIGMLISEAAVDTEELEKQVLAYRKKSVRQVIPPKSDDRQIKVVGQNVVELPVRTPGRPRKRLPG